MPGNILMDPLAHKVTMVCTLVLFLKLFVTTLIQGGKRFAGGTRPPEDNKLSLAKKHKVKQSYGMVDADTVKQKHVEADIRWQRIVHNDLENVLIGLILAWASLMSPYSVLVHCIATIVFTVARVIHTYAYANEKQPHRAFWWFMACLGMMAMAINGTMGVLTQY